MIHNGRKGCLTLVGTGIKARFQLSLEAISALKCADKVFYLVCDTLTERWIRKINPTAESLASSYDERKQRIDSYTEMVQRILGEVRNGSNVCAAFYGHPGVGVYPAAEVLRIARTEGVEARMHPGISAEDCLFADMRVDPLASGCQSYEATDFLIYKRIFDPRSPLILWQVGVLANSGYKASGRYDLRCLPLLQEVLLRYYPSGHKITLYCAAMLSVAKPSIRKLRLSSLSKSSLHSGCTMYVPPIAKGSPDRRMLKRMGALLETT